MREFMIVARSRLACFLFGHKDRAPGRCYRIACVGRLRAAETERATPDAG